MGPKALARLVCSPTRVLRHALSKGKPDFERPHEGTTPLIRAAVAGRCEAVLVLLEMGAKTGTAGATRWGLLSPVEACCEADGFGTVTSLAHLADFGALAVSSVERGEPPLVRLLRVKRPEAEAYLKTGILLRAGADPRSADGDGSTAMLLAARNGEIKVCQALFDRGGDPFEQNMDGDSASHEFRRRGLQDSIGFWRACCEARELLDEASAPGDGNRRRRRI
jgi:hypothetical protein